MNNQNASPERMAELHAANYAHVHDQLRVENNLARRDFLQKELDRHIDNYVYWTSHDDSPFLKLGFAATQYGDGKTVYSIKIVQP